MRQWTRQLALLFLIIVTAYLVGTVGYLLIEDWTLLDSFYMTAITLTTVGFSEVQPLSPAGQIFTILLIISGVGIVAYAVSTFSQYLLTPGIGDQLRRRRMTRKIADLDGHFIVCGYGALGKVVADTLVDNHNQVVVIEPDPASAEEARRLGLLVLEDSATQDDQLQLAGIEQARGLITCAQSDADNLLIVFSGRALNPDLYIVARARTADAENKLMRAGADKVISPALLGGRHMANLAMRPRVMEFVEFVTLRGDLELALEELNVESGSTLIGQSIAEADIRRRTGATLVSLHRGPTNKTIPLDGEFRFSPGDVIIALGTVEQLAALEDIASARH